MSRFFARNERVGANVGAYRLGWKLLAESVLIAAWARRLRGFGGRNGFCRVGNGGVRNLELKTRQRGDREFEAGLVAVNVNGKREVGRAVAHERLDALWIDSRRRAETRSERVAKRVKVDNLAGSIARVERPARGFLNRTTGFVQRDRFILLLSGTRLANPAATRSSSKRRSNRSVTLTTF